MRLVILVLFITQYSLTSCGQTSQYSQSEDIVIHYQTFGSGKPILIINGGPGFSSEGFLPIANKIASLGYMAILYDQRGTGKSTLSPLNSKTITMDLMAQDIETIRAEMEIEEWMIFGHSFGGIMANYYAAKYPERVSAMIHSSSGGIDLSIQGEVQEYLYARLSQQEADSLNFWRQQFSRSNAEADRLRYNQYLAKAYVYDQRHVNVVAQRLMQGDLALNRLVWNDLIRIDYDCKASLKTFDKPVLIIQGEQDIIPKEIAHIAADVFLNAEVVFLAESGHYGWLDQEEKYLSEINSFLMGME